MQHDVLWPSRGRGLSRIQPLDVLLFSLLVFCILTVVLILQPILDSRGKRLVILVGFIHCLKIHTNSCISHRLLRRANRSASAHPGTTSLAFTLRSARPALISWLSLSTISTGVSLGTPTPNQALDS